MGMWGHRFVQSTFFTTQNMDGTRLKLLRLSSCSLFFRSSDHAMSFQHVLHWQPSTMRSQGQADKHCKDVAFDDVFLLDAPFSGAFVLPMAKTIKFLRFQDGYSKGWAFSKDCLVPSIWATDPSFNTTSLGNVYVVGVDWDSETGIYNDIYIYISKMLSLQDVEFQRCPQSQSIVVWYCQVYCR